MQATQLRYTYLETNIENQKKKSLKKKNTKWFWIEENPNLSSQNASHLLS